MSTCCKNIQNYFRIHSVEFRRVYKVCRLLYFYFLRKAARQTAVSFLGHWCKRLLKLFVQLPRVHHSEIPGVFQPRVEPGVENPRGLFALYLHH
jgi:hypothetical protein